MYRTTSLLLVCAGCLGAMSCGRSQEAAANEPADSPQAHERILPQDPVHDAIYERFGNPDRVDGSGLGFLHYDLINGQSLILVVSGDRIMSAEITDK